MHRRTWTSVGVGLLAIVVAAILIAPNAGVLRFDASRLPPFMLDPATRLLEMMNAGTAAGPALVASASVLRVGPNVQVFDNRRPQNEIAAAANPADARNLLIGSNDYRIRGTVWAGVYTSTDAARSWTAQLVPGYPGGPEGTLSEFQAGGDPIVGFASDGTAYAGGIFFKASGSGGGVKDVTIALSRSDDGGVTWNDAVIVAPGKGNSPFNDHPQMAVDSTGGPFDGHVYISWTRFGGEGQIDIYVAASADRGATWSATKVSGPIPHGDAEGFYQDSMVAIGPGGIAYIVWDEWFHDNGNVPRTKIWMTSSTDGGATFAPSWIVDADVIPIHLPNASYRHDSYPTAAVDTSGGAHDGRIYLAWSDDRNGDADILLKSSDDGGASWSSIVRVNDDAGTAGQFMQWIVVGPDGRVDVSFYDRRDDPNDYLLNEYMARSTDGGSSFVNVRVSNVSSDPAVWPTFIGDYNQIAATSRASYPAWSDFRNGVPGNFNQDAYTAAVFV